MNGLICLILVVAILVGYRVWLGRSRRLREPVFPNDFAVTGDGARIALYHRPNPRGDVVLMVHGLGANHFNFDFPLGGRPAALYHDAGYDVWTLDLRGHGGSSHGPRWYDWGFDDFVEQDLPAVISHIRERTGGRPMHWVGHSMGGMLFYALAGRNPELRFASAVTLGSPVSFFSSTRFIRWAHRNGAALEKLRIMPIQTFLRWINPVLPWGPRAAVESQMYPDNVDWQTIHHAAFHATENISIRLLLDFARWVVSGEWRGEDGFDYRAAMAGITTPVLVVAGSRDKLCPARDIRYAFDLLGSTDKRYFVAGPEAGYQNHYGHIDMVFGRFAEAEVLQEALAWTEAHCSGTDA